MHILLIEDDATLIDLFRVQIRRFQKHTAKFATSKKQTLDLFTNEIFDLIFVDMGLEGRQNRGLEILTEIKTIKPSQRIGILSSNDNRDIVRSSQAAGAEFYIVKPFTFRGLMLVLDGDKEAIRNYQPDIREEGPIIAF